MAAEIPELIVSRDVTPHIFEHIVQATSKGQPTLLTYWPQAEIPDPYKGNLVTGNPHRINAMAHFFVEDHGRKPKPGKNQSLDEYPFACTKEGGTDSSVTAVPQSEQSIQGGQLAAFLFKHKLKRGDLFRVRGDPDLFDNDND